MNRLFLLLFGMVTFVAHAQAQVPDYVPTEGLVAWWPLDESLNDLGPNGLDATSNEEEYSCTYLDSFCNLELSEASQEVLLPSGLELNGTDGGITCAAWLRLDDMGSSEWKIAIDLTDGMSNNGWGDRFVLGVIRSDDTFYWNSGGHFDNNIYVDYGLSTAYPIEEGIWYHFAATWDFEGNLTHYIQGQPIDSIVVSDIGDFILVGGNEGSRKIGARAHNSDPNLKWVGGVRDIGFWQRPLSSQEVAYVFNETDPMLGCTDPTACNFVAEATGDDGSCIFAPLVDLGEDIATCEESVILDAGEGFSHYEWNTGDTSRSIVVSEAGEYSVFTSNTAPNQHALKFNGNDASAQFAESIMFGMESFSISVDCRLNDFSGNDSEPYSYIIGHPLTGGTNDYGFKIQTASNSFNGGFQAHINDEGTEHFNVISFDNSMEPNVELDQWYDLTMVVDRDNALFSFYIDGVLIDAQAIHPDFGNLDHPDGLSLGIQSIHQSSLLDGDLDNLHVWDIALNAEQIAQFQTSVPSGNEEGLVGFWNFEEGEGIEANDISGLAPSIQLNNAEWTEDGLLSMVDPACAAYDSIQISFLTSSCLDPEACNYNALAECAGEACDYTCCPGPGCCLDGTAWDAELGGCVPEDPNDATANSCPHDIDFDGLIGVVDLMDLLSVFGTDCPETDDTGDDPETAEFTCGGPVNYQGYDYATVQIGEQCWFAENLRTSLYSNGDIIPANLSDSEWSSTTSGAMAVYGEGSSACNSESPDGDACDSSWSLNEYGRLYNWHAVDDAHGLCPTGWHVPTDGEWMTLEMELGMSESDTNNTGWRGTDQGTQMKSSYGWGTGNGINFSNFSGVPSGHRGIAGGFAVAGLSGHLWSSSTSGSGAWGRSLSGFYSTVDRNDFNPSYGFSVRCLQDSE